MTMRGIAGVGVLASVLVTGLAGCGARVAVSPESAALATRPATVYVTDFGSGTVTPILVSGDKRGRPVKVGSGPLQILIGPGGKVAYVASKRDVGSGKTPATITAIRTATNTSRKPRTVCRATEDPEAAMAITPGGRTLYYACENADTVVPIRTATLRPGKPVKVGLGPDAIAITPDGKTAYVANSGGRTVTPISTATNTAGQPIRTGLGPFAMAITPNGKTAYVTNLGSGTVTPITVATGQAGRAIKVGKQPSNLAITRDGKTVYVVDSNPFGASGSVIPIRVVSNSPGKRVKVGRFPFGIAIDP